MPNFNLVISTFWLKTAKCLEDVGGFFFAYLHFKVRKQAKN